MKPGDKAVLFNGRGRELTAEAVDVGRNEIRFRKLHETETPPLRCRIILGQAIPKGKNMDLIVQKAVELGAAGIAPLISERTIVDLDPDDALQKQAKWQQVAIEAAKQCGQNWLPRVESPRKLKEFFSGSSSVAAAGAAASPANFGVRLIASLQPDAKPLKEILASCTMENAAANDPRPTSVLMLIGPEGDFTPAELSLAKSHGCEPITLGPIILRVETAAIYCLSVLSYELL
jgi:16S rRNA (uracil1498-N3)-methyltransferase